MNDLAVKAARVEDNHSRHCSFTGGESGGVVLHSAKHRNTVFLKGRSARKFLSRAEAIGAGVISANELDELIESYF